MSILQFVWIGDLDSKIQALQNPDALTHERCHPKRMIVKADRKETRIGRKNSKMPPDYALESAVSNRMISRNHVTIERLSKGNYMLYDHSLNGTYVNFVRVIGGTILKNDDVVCFGHINGANIKPGENVTPFSTDLKYRVEIIDKTIKKTESFSQSESSQEEEQPKSKNNKHNSKIKRKPVPHTSDLSEQSSDESEGSNVNNNDRFAENIRKKKPADLSSLSSSEDDNNDGVSRFKTSNKFNKKRHLNSATGEARFTDTGVSKKRKLESAVQQQHKSNHHHKKQPMSGADGLGNSGGGSSKPRLKTEERVRDHRGSVSHSGGGGSKVNSGASKNNSGSKQASSGGGSKRAGAGNNNNVNSSYEYEECSARPCLRPDQEALIDWIMCDKCSQWYHQSCVGLDEAVEDDESYYCPYCTRN